MGKKKKDSRSKRIKEGKKEKHLVGMLRSNSTLMGDKEGFEMLGDSFDILRRFHCFSQSYLWKRFSLGFFQGPDSGGITRFFRNLFVKVKRGRRREILRRRWHFGALLMKGRGYQRCCGILLRFPAILLGLLEIGKDQSKERERERERRQERKKK